MTPETYAAIFAGSAFAGTVLAIVITVVESHLTRRRQRRDELHRITQRIRNRREGMTMRNSTDSRMTGDAR